VVVVFVIAVFVVNRSGVGVLNRVGDPREPNPCRRHVRSSNSLPLLSGRDQRRMSLRSEVRDWVEVDYTMHYPHRVRKVRIIVECSSYEFGGQWNMIEGYDRKICGCNWSNWSNTGVRVVVE
jgi:hypothetical protein